MEISGSYSFNAAPDRVWALLMDPAVLSSCIPGCERFEPDGDDRYRVTLTVGLAAITGTYSGTVVLTDKVPNTSYHLVVEGQGRLVRRQALSDERGRPPHEAVVVRVEERFVTEGRARPFGHGRGHAGSPPAGRIIQPYPAHDR
jgi:hypothetical protein